MSCKNIIKNIIKILLLTLLINQVLSKISIEFDKDVSTFLYLEGREDRIKLIGIDGLDKKYLEESENIISLSGNSTNDKTIGSVKVRSSNAEIELMFD